MDLNKKIALVVGFAFVIAILPIAFIGHFVFGNEPTNLFGPHGIRQGIWFILCAMWSIIVAHYAVKLMKKYFTVFKF